jgi:Flp pilus assembly protein TadD
VIIKDKIWAPAEDGTGSPPGSRIREPVGCQRLLKHFHDYFLLKAVNRVGGGRRPVKNSTDRVPPPAWGSWSRKTKILGLLLLIFLIMITGFSCKDSRLSHRGKKQTSNSSLISNICELREQAKIVEGPDTIFDSAQLSRTLDSISTHIKTVIAGIPSNSIPGALNSFVFDSLGLQFVDDRSSTDAIFPDCVLRNKKGSCLGISLVYLLIGERLNLSLYGVVVPGHFFVRYGTGAAARNIETMKQGKSFPDSWYNEKFVSPAGSSPDFHSLSNEEVKGVICFTEGNIYLEKKNYDTALKEFKRAAGSIPWYAEVWGNLAVAQGETGQTNSALQSLDKARSIAPLLRNLDKNRASLLLKKNDFKGALQAYHAALNRAPDDPSVLYGMGYAYYALGQREQAKTVLGKLNSLHPDYPGAAQLIDKMRK